MTSKGQAMIREQAVAEPGASAETQERVWDSFRRWGYLQADLDPLGDLEPVPMPEPACEFTGSLPGCWLPRGR